MDGYELYDKMKKINTKVKVCPMSGFDMDADAFREKFPTLDTECFIPKPIQIKELVKRIETELLRRADKRIRYLLYILCVSSIIVADLCIFEPLSTEGTEIDFIRMSLIW